MKLYQKSEIEKIKEKYGFKFSKNLGQNFLMDKNIIDKIIEGTEINAEDTVIEIGPGIGVITQEAANRAKKVIAVEIDKSLIPILEETLAEHDNIKIIMKILNDEVKAKSITVMMQKEVAERIKAEPGTKTYGAISVAVQYSCLVKKIADVPRTVFVPQPNVDSTVLKLIPRGKGAVEVQDKKLFFECIKAGFGQRRKTLSNSLQTIRGTSKETIIASLNAAGIEPTRRAETLTLEEFGKLSNEVYKRL